MTMNDIVVRSYREGDEGEINRLFNEVFSEARSLSEWRWKFKENPTGAMMIAVAETGGRIVGHYATMPALFQYFDRVIRVAVPVDNFVLPEFRGRMRILKSIYEYQGRLWNHVLGFGFPKEGYSVVGKRILKYRSLGMMPVLFRRLSIRLAARRVMPWLPSKMLDAVTWLGRIALERSIRARADSAASNVKTGVVEDFDARFDEFWERIRRSYRIMCVRDRRFLSWRYKRPGATYRIIVAEVGGDLVGYAIAGIKREPGGVAGYIADLVTDDCPGAGAALVSRALLELTGLDADYAICWMLPDKANYRTLQDFGFAPRESTFPQVNMVFQCFDPEAVDLNMLQDPSNWYLTMGDSDVF